jgi:CPA2 family monovalent cation:H+ antiporter-2
MLFNPAFVVSHPQMVLGALAVVLIVKPLAALALIVVLGGNPRTALTVAVGLAQIGEFSFILAVLGQSLGVLPAEGMDILVAAALASIAVNPLLFRLLDRLERWLAARGRAGPRPAGSPEAPQAVAPPVVVTGMEEAGRRVARRLAEDGVRVCAVSSGLQGLEALQAQGIATVFGDAGRAEVLRSAGAAGARIIVVTNAALPEKIRICIAARSVNPRIAVVAIAGSDAERAWLEEFGASVVLDALDEMTDALVRSVRSAL